MADLSVGGILIIHKHAVGSKGKAEVFALLLFHAPCIRHKVLYHLKIHQRLAAEKVHLKIAAAAGIFHKEIQRTLAHFKAHHSPVAMIVALTGKAI